MTCLKFNIIHTPLPKTKYKTCKQAITLIQMKINLQAIWGLWEADASLCVRSLSVGTSSFWGDQKAVTQQAHSLLPQWDKHNNGRDQCTQGQQRPDKGFLKDQQAWFTIDIALKENLIWKKQSENENWLNLMGPQINSVFCWTTDFSYSLSAVIRLFLLNQFSANQM